MDLETENRLASLLMEEARRLRREADKEGVHAYLHKPNVRGRPNSRFLTATVLGIEQANRAAEINEMWRAREKERGLDVTARRHELEEKNIDIHVEKEHLNDTSRSCFKTNLKTSLNKHLNINSPCENSQSRYRNDLKDSSNKHYHEKFHSRSKDGLQDDEIEEFLHSRVKRGRGSVGCRMDEPGPYLSSTSPKHDEEMASLDRVEKISRILGPEKSHFLNSKRLLERAEFSTLKATDECISKKDCSKEKRKSKQEKIENKTRKETSKHRKRGELRKRKA